MSIKFNDDGATKRLIEAFKRADPIILPPDPASGPVIGAMLKELEDKPTVSVGDIRRAQAKVLRVPR